MIMNNVIYNDLFCPYCGGTETKQTPNRIIGTDGIPVMDGFVPNAFFCLNCGYKLFIRDEPKIIG